MGDGCEVCGGIRWRRDQVAEEDRNDYCQTAHARAPGGAGVRSRSFESGHGRERAGREERGGVKRR